MEEGRTEKLARWRVGLSVPSLIIVALLLPISNFGLCKIQCEEKIPLFLKNFFENYLFNYNFVPKHFGLI